MVAGNVSDGGGSSQDGGGSGRDSGGSRLDAGVDATPLPMNVFFVSSIVKSGSSINSVEEVDGFCTELAQEAGLPDNTYLALLPSAGAGIAERVGGARGWRRVDGLPFADRIQDIVNGDLFSAGNLSDSGDRLPFSSAITGTDVDATIGETCEDFGNPQGVMSVGTVTSQSKWFIGGATTSCSLSKRIYCLGTEHQNPLFPGPAAGRRAFLTRGEWTPGGGRSDADGLCRQEAAAAGLPGNFFAFLSLSTEAASARFNLGAGPWIGTDGRPIANTANALMDLLIDNAIDADASGDALDTTGLGSTIQSVWTGGPTPTESGMSCSDWTSAASADQGAYGDAHEVGAHFFFLGNMSCDRSARLYCLEQ